VKKVEEVIVEVAPVAAAETEEPTAEA